MRSPRFALEGGRRPKLHVYAVWSRRAGGLSIGVNLNLDKACNFACAYCQVDRTVPGRGRGVDVARLARELAEALASGRERAVDIAFAGDGEPTAVPEFPDAARAAREVRDRRAPGLPLRLLTNATLFGRAGVRAALVHFDELWCKLDAGTERWFRQVNGTEVPYGRILDNLLRVGRERPIVVQSLFPAVGGAGPPDVEVDAYLGRLRDLAAGGALIGRVQVYSVARPPADPRVAPLPRVRLEEIAGRVRALGLAAEVHPRSAPGGP
jgi:wyosine [tRNA(Phe)-imidazoG37] synthetase (radical SAM superfamily)